MSDDTQEGSLDGTSSASSSLPGLARGERWIRVWDLPTRTFHWLLVLLVATGVFTGFVAPEWWMGVHVGAGYGLVALIVFRLAWGVFGPEYSRIVSFVYAPRDILQHLRGLLLLRPPHYVGHNPTGALMVFALAGVLIALVVTGLLALGGEEQQGPLAAIVGYSVGSAAKRLHFWLTIVLLAMVGCHVAGVVAESVLGPDNLVRAIVTGWKRLPATAPVPTPRAARPVHALAFMLGLAGAAAAALGWLSQLPPPLGPRPVSSNATYQKECGACHYAFNPGLLPSPSWVGLTSGLREHFGEDARLDEATTRTLLAWLAANAAETLDTESANRFRDVAPDQPYRITATPYWVRKHAGISPDLFARTSVRSKLNCPACHRDAESGRYDDQAIAIPKE